ncbi:1-phosphatidylinositol 4,5-bisphosphate phosphodiesterase gamma-2-like [Huso huso]|uniref:Phosphoinositide phospholipase C n=1 Tax=Huso huso TaxID=61971 RepID=A0ABR0Z611_HUSHU
MACSLSSTYSLDPSTVKYLEMGHLMSVYKPKKVLMTVMTVKVIMETRWIVWLSKANKFEGVVDIREIQEIRRGKNSKGFNCLKQELSVADGNCFTILYGSEFVLKTLSLSVDTKETAEKWITALEKLKEETLREPTPQIVKRWLKKQMYSINTYSTSITLKEFKAILTEANFKVPSMKFLKDLEASKSLNFETLHNAYNKLMYESQKQILEEKDFLLYKRKSPGFSVVDLEHFQKFLLCEQKDDSAADLQWVKELMQMFIDGNSKEKRKDPEFTDTQFLNYLFSKENSIWDTKVTEYREEDMCYPLCDYWINSSHNTYLTGNQISSNSSAEAYIRCLRMGCRCIELDCFDGDSKPNITHGKTFTSKITFDEVVEAINDHAFEVSEFPVILSIEEHCSTEQQGYMAKKFKEVFKDKLLTEQAEVFETQLPSPMQLKRKIIIKHKTNALKHTTRKEGHLQIWDPLDEKWHCHFCLNTDDKFYYSQEIEEDSAEELESAEMHLSEIWFHGKMENRRAAERCLQQYCAETGGMDGTFLVRESNTYAQDYIIVFWKSGKCNQFRIRSNEVGGTKNYFLIDSHRFGSLHSLIQHYKKRPFKFNQVEQYLTDAVPNLNLHECQRWFYSSLCREEAEEKLFKVPKDGAFLIRGREEPGSFAITFKAEGKVKHCKIQREGRIYIIGTSAEFESLVELVNYYRKTPLYRKMRLRYPVTEELLQRCSTVSTFVDVYGTMYVDPSEIEASVISVKAVYDYQKSQPDELSFARGAIIHNVTKESQQWWRGDYEGKVQHFFPSSYVEEITKEELRKLEVVLKNNPLEGMCKGVVNLSKCSFSILPGMKNGKEFVFMLQQDDAPSFEIAASSLEDLYEWESIVNKWAVSSHSRIPNTRLSERDKRKKDKIVHRDMLALVIYCKPKSGKKNKFDQHYEFTEVRSFDEELAPIDEEKFVEYNSKALSRIYPRGGRVDSSNYNPLPYWLRGCQLVALNFQTPDKSMHVNKALFDLNGKCGFRLQPKWLKSLLSKPFIDKTVEQTIEIRVLGARHLPKPSRNVVSPFVEVQVYGVHENNTLKTMVVSDNGLNPVWLDTPQAVKFNIYLPELAFLRFCVCVEDMFSDPHFLAQATLPVKGIRSGYRSVPLKNGYSEDIELASLLVHVSVNESGAGN